MGSNVSKKKKKIRPLGDILLDIEPYLIEMIESHDLQWSDCHGLLFGYLQAHFPKGQEEYLDGTKAVTYVGHKDGLK